MFVWTWHREILRHHSSWRVLSQQPIPFLYVSEHAQSMPSYAPPAGPPRSLFLSAWPAPQWLSIDQLQNMHTLIYTQTHTSSRRIPLGALPSLFPGFFFSFYPPRFFFWYEDLQMCADSCFLYFYLNWGPKENKKANTVWYLVCSYPGPLTSNWHFVVVLLFFAKQRSAGDSKKRASSDGWKQKTLLQNVNQHPCILSFLSFVLSLSPSIHLQNKTFVFVKHPRHHPDCFLCVFHVLYWNLGWVFCTMDTTCSPNKMQITTKKKRWSSSTATL